jgi:hypothetical protein
MEILTGMTIFATTARRHFLSSISLIALKVALAVIIGITVTIALGTRIRRRAIGTAHSLNFGTNVIASST